MHCIQIDLENTCFAVVVCAEMVYIISATAKISVSKPFVCILALHNQIERRLLSYLESNLILVGFINILKYLTLTNVCTFTVYSLSFVELWLSFFPEFFFVYFNSDQSTCIFRTHTLR